MEDEIKKMIVEKYGSMRSFSEKIGIPNSTVVSILDRGINNSNISNVMKMCKELKISVDKLIDENKIVSILQFDNADLSDVLSDTIQIPVLGVIKAGTAIEAQQDILEYIDIPREWTNGGKNFYGLQINGDSMYPKYEEKDIVIFEQTEDYVIANKKDCAVMVNGYDATFKNVTISEDGITLVPLNLNNSDNYQPTFFNKEQIEKLPVKIVGIAREKRTRL